MYVSLLSQNECTEYTPPPKPFITTNNINFLALKEASAVNSMSVLAIAVVTF
jgi:hypothetical protein